MLKKCQLKIYSALVFGYLKCRFHNNGLLLWQRTWFRVAKH